MNSHLIPLHLVPWPIEKPDSTRNTLSAQHTPGDFLQAVNLALRSRELRRYARERKVTRNFYDAREAESAARQFERVVANIADAAIARATAA